MQKNVQLGHADHQPSTRKFPLQIIASDITSPLNVGSLFRICDALAIDRLYLCGDSATPPNTKITRTSRSTERSVPYENIDDAKLLAGRLRDTGTLMISLEITASSIDIRSDEFAAQIAADRMVCLILGSEKNGVSESLLKLSDVCVHIPMFGNNSSMNVITAAAIACFEITRLLDRTSA